MFALSGFGGGAGVVEIQNDSANPSTATRVFPDCGRMTIRSECWRVRQVFWSVDLGCADTDHRGQWSLVLPTPVEGTPSVPDSPHGAQEYSRPKEQRQSASPTR